MQGASLTIGGVGVGPGEVRKLEIPVARLPTQNQVSIPVAVVCGLRPGPRLWLSAAIHGDEINGVEVIRRVLEDLPVQRLRGAVVAVPIVNVFGFLNESRYLPDRRDLNRCFPGSARGSLGSRLAHILMREVVANCTHGIDLHTGSGHRLNLPQVRGDLGDAATRAMAESFGAPVMIHARLRDGSLREAASRRGCPVLVYEGGEANRFDPEAIEAGVQGVFRVMNHLGMGRLGGAGKPRPVLRSEGSSWVRAGRSGLFRSEVSLGERVRKGTLLGTISDAFGDVRVPVKSTVAGLVIGLAMNPLVHRGDALVHVARVDAA